MELASLSLSILKGAIAPFLWLWKKISQPSLSYDRAPRNILQITFPGNSMRLVEQKFGVPPREFVSPDGSRVVGYVFSNALLQICYNNSNAISSVILMNLHRGWELRFPLNLFRYFIVPYANVVIGRSSVKDVFEQDAIALRKEYSSKFCILWEKIYLGNPGRYKTYQFGLMEADAGAEVGVQCDFPDYIHVDGEGQGLAHFGNAGKYKVNVVRISDDNFDEIDWFGYWHGMFP
ncbi:ETEC_3214 domain-containing protein [Aquitalea pelogenes]|uniref:ETEC_3214 domain-containing protein n=1 Tax=Aquitalea pelogenes TaxID=1293573 RepID=UPI00128FBB70|nr:ETEC_3214 domain-containing protein [Aquitalea pelogenes]